MLKFLSDDSAFIHNEIKIALNIKCALCNSQIKARIVGECSEVQVLPCENCVNINEEDRRSSLKYMLVRHQNYVDRMSEKDKKENEEREERIFKKFEERFRRLMKEAEDVS